MKNGVVKTFLLSSLFSAFSAQAMEPIESTETEASPIVQALYLKTRMESLIAFGKKPNKDEMMDYLANYNIPILVKNFEQQFKHAPFSLQQDLSGLKEQSAPLLEKQSFVKSKKAFKAFNDAIKKNEIVLKTPTYNFNSVKPLPVIINALYINDFGRIEDSKRNEHIKDTLQFAIRKNMTLSANEYSPKEDSKNPYFDAQRDYVVPQCITTFYEIRNAKKDYPIKQALINLKTCIEKSENEEFSEHMKPALEKIDQEL